MTEREQQADVWRVQRFVDREMTADEQAAFAVRVAAEPDLARQVAEARRTGEALRAYDAFLDEPVPAAVLGALGAPRRRVFAPAASAALFLLGLALGWFLRPAVTGPPEVRRALPEEAAFAHAIYVRERRHAVEVKADEVGHLNAWLSKRLQHQVEAPDLQALGLSLVGGRLLADAGRPAAHFMYENADGERFTLFVRVNDDRPRLEPARDTVVHVAGRGEVRVAYWATGALSYAWSGPGDDAFFAALVEATRQGRRHP